MCGIAGIHSLKNKEIPRLEKRISIMNKLQEHRGPDGEGVWCSEKKDIGFGHRRLSIIDLQAGGQPMQDERSVIVFNGEIYNYLEIKQELSDYRFKTHSDTEVILAAYDKWGTGCLKKLRGMFSFALYDKVENFLFCARDSFGIKPFYYLQQDGCFYFSSETKALMPFIDKIETDMDVLKEYLFLQVLLTDKTLFKNISLLLPGHFLTIKNGSVQIHKYWDVEYDIDYSKSKEHFIDKLKSLMEDSCSMHLRSDVPVGSYVSGGLDSSYITAIAAKQTDKPLMLFNGKFSEYGAQFDESQFAKKLAQSLNLEMLECDISAQDFVQDIEKVIYYLDYPIAGPGSFAQYEISKFSKNHRKVILGGQGADEIFGGYTRYLIAYFEQCIKGAIEGTLHDGNFLVTYESIIKNLKSLKNYKPLIQQFFSSGMFGNLDQRYFALINRSPMFLKAISWENFSNYDPYESFAKIFNDKAVSKSSYFDKMTHFDFKTLLPGLLQVEDRVSMANGIESRVPFIDKEIVEFAATIPAAFKFKDGTLKQMLYEVADGLLPKEILSRTDKMGFPVPLKQWLHRDIRDFSVAIFEKGRNAKRNYIEYEDIHSLVADSDFGRNYWGVLSLEIWHQQFHDRDTEFKKMIEF